MTQATESQSQIAPNQANPAANNAEAQPQQTLFQPKPWSSMNPMSPMDEDAIFIDDDDSSWRR